MQFKQYYLGCLAHASYLVASNGEAAIVDPQRDVDQYLADASAQGLTIRYVLETHLHADFVSGHRELAARSGAEIVFGWRAGAEFPHRAVRDGEELRLGSVVLRALETPGHTPESISWLVFDEAAPQEPRRLLTGDTLFIGDVGRPDLAGSKGFSAADMAAMLYDTLQTKILTLDDDVEVYPAHGAGSACGRNISQERSSTIGEQRRMNYALRPMSQEAFVAMMTNDLPDAPRYFPMDAELNRRGAGMLSQLHAASFSPREAQIHIGNGAMVLDVRDAASFGAAHVPGSLNIGLKGNYASWSGNLIAPSTPLILIVDRNEQVDEAVMRLARVGLENVIGYIEGGIDAWCAAGLPIATTPQISVHDLHARLERCVAPPSSAAGKTFAAEDGGATRLQIVDVRAPGEYRPAHVPGAVNVPLPSLEHRLVDLDATRPTAVICAGGYRSSVAASLMQRHGFADVANVIGGTSAWVGAGLETEAL